MKYAAATQKLSDFRQQIAEIRKEMRKVQAAIEPQEVADYEFRVMDGVVTLSALFGDVNLADIHRCVTPLCRGLSRHPKLAIRTLRRQLVRLLFVRTQLFGARVVVICCGRLSGVLRLCFCVFSLNFSLFCKRLLLIQRPISRYLSSFDTQCPARWKRLGCRGRLCYWLDLSNLQA